MPITIKHRHNKKHQLFHNVLIQVGWNDGDGDSTVSIIEQRLDLFVLCERVVDVVLG